MAPGFSAYSFVASPPLLVLFSVFACSEAGSSAFGAGVEKIALVSATKRSTFFSTSARVVVGSAYFGLDSISYFNLFIKSRVY